MNEIIENYLETKEFNQEKWSEDFDEYGEKEIEQLMFEIEKILRENKKILNGNFLPFIFK